MTNNIARLHIGLFGRRNTGKSSVINQLTGQNLSIVSDIPGTTTDPVKKAEKEAEFIYRRILYEKLLDCTASLCLS